jgi:hypothetical protein
MSLRVTSDGAGGYRLLSSQEYISGWVRGRIIGVAGFHEEDDAIDAAVRAYGVLAAWLSQQRLPSLPAFGCEPAHIIHDGAYRWIIIGRTPIARLTDGASNNSAPAAGFEILLRGSTGDGMAIHAGLIAVRAAAGKIGVADVQPALNAPRHLEPSIYARSS